MDNAFTVARGLDSKAADELVHDHAALFFLLVGERERTRGHADALVTLATELGNPFRRALGELYLGWCDSAACDQRDGIARMQRGLADFRATGSLTMVPAFLSLVAQSQGGFGHYDEASVAIREALTLIEETGERAYEAEVYRTKGELLMAKGASNIVPAEQAFRTAIGVASRQKAKSWELRATTGLARFLRETDRRDEARIMLAEIYNWFTEGFDTPDLKDAKALLEELNNSPG